MAEMKEIVGIRFRGNGKVYYFDPNGVELVPQDWAVVEIAKGIECGEVVFSNRQISSEEIPQPFRRVLRKVTLEDSNILEQNKRKEERAKKICMEKIQERKLDMRLINVECAFDNSKLMFYFTSENRVDFRNLVKDLASVFRMRIELRQIGVRDNAKILGGLGICGREFCCKGYLADFQPVSIKMAKEQGLSLNPSKISGCCGRLMCCLKHEQNVYEDFLKITPKVGATVVNKNDGTKGKVIESNTLTGDLRVQTEQSELPVKMHRDDVTIVRGENHSRQRNNNGSGNEEKHSKKSEGR